MQSPSALRFCTFALVASIAFSAGDDGYGYDEDQPDGPQHWGDLRPEWALCKDGREQSPIYIHTTKGIKGGKKSPIHTRKGIKGAHLPALNTSYVPAHAVVFNAGHALEVDVTDGDAGHFQLGFDDYMLHQFHFHSPSEHVIDGVRPPMEMHMVHQTADGTKTAVIGISFNHGPPSPFLDEFWDKLALLSSDEVGVEVDIGTLVIDEPHLRVGPAYARYQGSLTTPPCTENITWTVSLDTWNTISPDQLKAFKRILPDPIARPLQKLHGRGVRIYKP